LCYIKVYNHASKARTPKVNPYQWLIPYVDKRVDGRYKISAVDETGDRLAK